MRFNDTRHSRGPQAANPMRIFARESIVEITFDGADGPEWRRGKVVLRAKPRAELVDAN